MSTNQTVQGMEHCRSTSDIPSDEGNSRINP